MEARTRLKNGCAPGSDQVTAEMLCELPIEALLVFAKLFAGRYLGPVSVPIAAWALVLQVFLAKSAAARTLHEYRGVTLLSLVLKWYTNCLVILFERSEQPTRYSLGASF